MIIWIGSQGARAKVNAVTFIHSNRKGEGVEARNNLNTVLYGTGVDLILKFALVGADETPMPSKGETW